MKKVMCMVLAALLVLSLVGCGKGVQRLGEDGRYYMGSKEGEEAIKADPNLLDPARIFADLTYNEAMLHGNYELAYMEDNLEDFAKACLMLSCSTATPLFGT